MIALLLAASVTLGWHASGDDSLVGRATLYDLRYSKTAPPGSGSLEPWWTAATKATGLPVPLDAGTAQAFTVTALDSGATYHFLLRSVDDAGNVSPFSNLVSKAVIAPPPPPPPPPPAQAVTDWRVLDVQGPIYSTSRRWVAFGYTTPDSAAPPETWAFDAYGVSFHPTAKDKPVTTTSPPIPSAPGTQDTVWLDLPIRADVQGMPLLLWPEIRGKPGNAVAMRLGCRSDTNLVDVSTMTWTRSKDQSGTGLAWVQRGLGDMRWTSGGLPSWAGVVLEHQEVVQLRDRPNLCRDTGKFCIAGVDLGCP